jgi:hypothetical protein
MLTLLVILLLVALAFGAVVAVKVALWTLAIVAVVVLALVLGVRSVLRRT